MWNRHLLCLVNCCIYRHSASIDYNELRAMWCRLGNLQCISWNRPLVLQHFILFWLYCQISWICAIHLSICRSSSQLYGNVDDFSFFYCFNICRSGDLPQPWYYRHVYEWNGAEPFLGNIMMYWHFLLFLRIEMTLIVWHLSFWNPFTIHRKCHTGGLGMCGLKVSADMILT